jgi:HEAT repeat protein
VNKKARCSKALSAQPVVEESPQKSLTYWHILSALGNLKTDASFEFLLGAVSDHAPDKREKALSSLISVGKELSLAADKKAAMHEFLIEAFKDPSNLVKQTAIESAGILNDAALIEEVAAMAQAKEPSLWKEAHRTLKSMAQNGHKEQVCAAVKKRIESTGDAGRRERLTKLANELN